MTRIREIMTEEVAGDAPVADAAKKMSMATSVTRAPSCCSR